MLVGEAPGEREELEGAPFVGPAGWELDKWLRAAGLRRSDVFVTNVVRYRPPGNDIEHWIKPARKKGMPDGWLERAGRWYAPEVAEGLSKLREEIEQVQPRVIVALGNVPLWALTGEWGITDWRGRKLALAQNLFSDEGLPALAAVVVPVLHPAAVLRQYAWQTYAIHDFKKRVVPAL